MSLIWIFDITPPFEPEPVTAALGIIATALTVLTTKYSDALKKNSFNNDYKSKLAKEYIKKFKRSITSIITEKNITEYIRFTDSELIINP